MNAFERWVRRYCEVSVARPWWVLAVLGAVTVVSLLLGSEIRLNTDLKALLPEDAPSVQAINLARERRGDSDQFVIAVTSQDPQKTVDFVDALAARVATWPEVESVSVSEDREFFRQNALLYLPVEDLQQINRNIKRLIRKELGEANPLFVDLEAEGSGEPFDWQNPDNWVRPESLAELGISREDVSGLLPFGREGSGESQATPVPSVAEDAAAEAELETAAAAVEDPDERLRRLRMELPAKYRDYKMAPSGKVAVVTAKLSGRSTDIDYSRRMFEKGEALIRELDPKAFDPSMRAQVVGAYRGFLEVKAVSGDVTTATLLSIGMVVVLLMAFFRNVRSVLIVLLPLLVGVGWTLGLLDVVYGELNSLTAFVFSILIGMGIDFGIHIYRRAQDEYNRGLSWEEALFVSLTRTGRALLTATATTVAALLTLTLAHFDGFVEFGVACGLGVGICLLSSALVCPPLVGVTERLRPSARRSGGAVTDESPMSVGVLRAIRVLAVVVVVAAVVGVTVAPRAEFEYNFSNLERPKDKGRIGYSAALGTARSSTPSVILGESEAQMREVHQVLKERRDGGDPLIRAFSTVESLVPGDQDDRMEVIESIQRTINRKAVRDIGGEKGEMLERLRELTDVEPFDAEDLPEWARRTLTEKDGAFGRMGLLYGEYRPTDALDVMRFQEQFGTLRVSSGEVLVSSNGFIIADVVRFVQDDAVHLAWYVAIGLIVILLIDLRSVVGTLICMGTLATAVALTVLGMVLFDVRLGLYNIVVLPTVLGTGIDASIHIYHRHLEEGRSRLGVTLRTTGVAVMASSLTTVAGFLGLLMVEHRGVQTIGALATIGIAASLISALTVLPAILSFTKRSTILGRAPQARPPTP